MGAQPGNLRWHGKKRAIPQLINKKLRRGIIDAHWQRLQRKEIAWGNPIRVVNGGTEFRAVCCESTGSCSGWGGRD